MVIDSEAYSKIGKGSGRKAYVHAVSEIYVPGSSGDDLEKHPTFPVADGSICEGDASDDGESSEEPVTTAESLQTEIEETLLSSERVGHHNDPQNAGALVVGLQPR